MTALPSKPPLPPARPTFAPIDWENLIGVRLFSWIAGIALVFAAVFFLRWSIEHGWLGPGVRMAIGLATGLGLLAGCELPAARRYAVTANAIGAAGIAILFATLFASYALWHLMPQIVAFALMSAVTALAAMLSIRRDSPFIALLGLAGGFATPILLSRGDDNPIGLFGYLLLLNGGLAWVAYRRRWPALTALSIALTALYEWGWAWRFLDASRLPLAMTIFAMFPLLHLAALMIGGPRRLAGDDEGPEDSRFARAAVASTAMPVAFAIYSAAVPEYGAQFLLLFGFLFLVAAGLGAIAVAAARPLLYTVSGTATVAAFVVWIAGSYDASAWPGILAILAAFVLLHLAVPWAARRMGRPFEEPTASRFAPLLLFVLPVLVRIEPAASQALLPFATLFLLCAAVARSAIDADEPGMHLVASFFAALTGLVWFVTWLTPETLVAGVLVECAFVLLFAAVPVWAERAGRWRSDLYPVDRYVVLVAPLLLFFIASTPALAVSPWPLLAAIAVTNLALAAAALRLGDAGPHGAALVLAQVLLTVVVGENFAWLGIGVAAAFVLVLFAAGCAFAARRTQGGARFIDAAIGATFGAQLVAVFASIDPQGLPASLLLANDVALLAVLLALAAFGGRSFAAVAAVVPAAVQAAVIVEYRLDAAGWDGSLVFVAALWLPFLVHAALDKGRALGPALAAVLSAATTFLLSRECIEAGGHEGVVGLLPLAQAAALGLVLPALRRTEGTFALVAGAALAFVTVAIPLQLEHEWITIGWALEAAALAWLYRRVRRSGLLVFTAALGAAVFVRLTLNPAVLAYHPRAETPVWNWYLYTWLVPALSFFAAARLLPGLAGTELRRLRDLLNAAGGILLFLLLNIEIADWYSQGPSLTFNFSAGLAQDLSYTIGWAVFAIATLAVAIRQDSRVTRIASLALLVVTVSKCFLHDLWRLGGLYRVGSFVGLAVSLALVALLLQRFVLGAQKETA